MSTKAVTPPAQDTLAGALKASVAHAAEVQPRKEAGERVAGPFPVGNLGETEVRKVTRGSAEYLNAIFTPAGGGKVQRIPLAAVAALHTELG